MNKCIILILIQAMLAITFCLTALEENVFLSACPFFSACAAVEAHNMYLYSKGKESMLRIIKSNPVKEANYLCQSIIASALCFFVFLIYNIAKSNWDLVMLIAGIAILFDVVSYVIASAIKRQQLHL